MSGVPIFSLVPQPGEVARLETAQIYLFDDLPEQFADLTGEEVWFFSSSDSGHFFNDGSGYIDNLSYVDLNANSKLNPNMWYYYDGLELPLADTLYAYCISQTNDTLAWDSCLVRIISSP